VSGGNLGPRGEGVIARAAGETVVLGALDKSLIEQVIKRNLNSIRYCYSRELNRNPTLGGKLTVKFTIASDGSVAKAETKQGIGSPAVESCVAERFLRFKFPAPKGGGVVVVSYPIVFSRG
jgi:TonB family protein